MYRPKIADSQVRLRSHSDPRIKTNNLPDHRRGSLKLHKVSMTVTRCEGYAQSWYFEMRRKDALAFHCDINNNF